MTQHVIKQRIQTEHFEVLIFSDAMKGYFEHHHMGNEYVVGTKRRGGTYFVWPVGGGQEYHLPRRMFKYVEVL